MSASGFNRFAHTLHFVDRQVVHDDRLALSQGGHQSDPHPSQEHFSVYWPFKNPGGTGSGAADAGDQRGRQIMSLRDVSHQPLVGGGTAILPGHLQIGAALVHEYQAAGTKRCDTLRPASTLLRHVGPVLLGGVERFFYTSVPVCAPISP